MALPLQQPSMTESQHRRQRSLHRQALITTVDCEWKPTLQSADPSGSFNPCHSEAAWYGRGKAHGICRFIRKDSKCALPYTSSPLERCANMQATEDEHMRKTHVCGPRRLCELVSVSRGGY